ncbi:MAG: DMT family transporter [Rhodospirillales bacterium]
MSAQQISAREETQAKLACAYAGAAWGLFWIPLRKLEDLDIVGVWPSVLFFVVPLVIMLPVLLFRWRAIVAGGIRPQLIGLVCGAAIAIYANSVIYTEVVRAMLLYYMTPVWSILLARVWLGERITASQIIAIVIGVAGMMAILHIDKGFPWPRNLGDWFGLTSGVVWAVGAVLMRETPNYHAVDLTWAFLFWSAVGALLMAFMPFAPPPPTMENVVASLPWLAPATLVIVVPALFAVMWGAPKLNPGVVGLLFMTEITVGAVTAALWAGEPFGAREITGVVLISLAGVVEIVFAPLQRLMRRSRSERA